MYYKFIALMFFKWFYFNFVELSVMAKYPFISSAREWVKKEGVRVEEILFDEIYERARGRGAERVMQALERGLIKDVPLLEEADFIMEIFSYPVARMIVVASGSDYVIRRYSLAESKRAYENLKNENIEFIERMAAEFGIRMNGNRMYFVDYLRYAPTWDIKWKLVNRELRKGEIILEKHELARLLQEAIRKKIYSELLYMYPPPEIKKAFGDIIEKIKAKVSFKEEKERIDEVDARFFPPCIKNLISATKSGVNVPHVGRFTLVTFLNALGMSIDEILKIFSSSPDFNPEKTRYQIEHITGKISGTDYTPPKCDTIRTWGLCFPDEICKRIRHPLSYYRLKRRRK